MTNVVPEEKISSLGIVRIDENKRVIDFYEKPETPDLVEDFKLDTENSNWLWS